MIQEIPIELKHFIGGLYPDSGAHGKDHALQTSSIALEISNEPEYVDILTDRDRTIILAAALVHDAGYIREPYWSGTQWEHPYVSTEILLENLDKIPDLTDMEKTTIGLLVLNHDNTNYRFPAYPLFERERNGFTEPVGSPPGPPPGILFDAFRLGDHIEDLNYKKFQSLLHVLQEADSRLGSAQRTIDFSKSRNIPIFADDGGIPGIGMPMWQLSGLANVELAAKRVLLDAYTKTGQEFAWNMFIQTRDFMKRLLQETGLVHDKDTLGEILRRKDIENYVWNSQPEDRERPHTHINQAFSLEGVPYILAEGYERYSAASRLVNINNISTAGPRNMSDIEKIRELRGIIIKNYAVDVLTELSGALRIFHGSLTRNTREYTLVPPITISLNQTTFDNDRIRIEHGKHWVDLAKELGLSEMRIIYLYEPKKN